MSQTNPGPTASRPYYITTPIYYVNDRPHIGHCYTTTLADVAARAQRLIGRDVFFLTGTDEHADKVSKAAHERGKTPIEWADENAARFKDAFAFMRISNDDFVRTTEPRHKERASAYIKRLMDQGDIALGDYEGWYDVSQEEYVTESTAKEHDFKSPVTGRPLEKRVEQNYFFDLPKYAEWLEARINSGELKIVPEARKNEVMGRIKQGLNKVPVSRRINPDDPEHVRDWGIRMPGDPDHRVYVWIEALCNYLTVMDNEAEPSTVGAEGERRRKWWPKGDASGDASGDAEIVHAMAKDILWFHAVIWPCMLHALGQKVPDTVYAHAYFIAEGKKMSKSLGNFIEIDQLKAYADRYSVDAVRWYLATQGPGGATDADFAYQRFVEVYNADLANGIGNATSRVANMIAKYYGGSVPDPVGRTSLDLLKSSSITETVNAQFASKGSDTTLAAIFHDYNWPELVANKHALWFESYALDADEIGLAIAEGRALSKVVDGFIGLTRPFSLAKDLEGNPLFSHLSNTEALATILYQCAEALRIASLFFYPALPDKMAQLWRDWNCSHLNDPNDADSGFVAPLSELAQWAGPHGLKPGQTIVKGEALFMRADAKDPAPGA
ncbi:MAG: methionine--tRNA ligase [Planctomycetota bacterium]